MQQLKKKSAAILLLFPFLYELVFAQLEKKDYSPSKIMNGYKLSDYEGFEKKWHLVTVRFRKDTNELRWTFANDSAWKTLESGTQDYPEGAVFAKVGIATADDPQFISSAVPIGARRYQFMVRGSKKHADTGGWGYALFDVNGNTFPEDLKLATLACFACHRIVENRGYVFSQPFQLSPHLKFAPISNKQSGQTLTFSKVDVSQLNNELKNLIGKKWPSVWQIDNADFRKSLFQGTLDEIRPTLEREAFDRKAPAALFSDKFDRYSIVLPIEKDGCKPGRAFLAIMTILDESKKQNLKYLEYCNP